MNDSTPYAPSLSYQTPPPAIAQLIDAPLTPTTSLSPANDWMLLLDRASHPPLSEVAAPELRLGGIRINPQTNGPSRASHFTSLRLKSVADGKEYAINNLPPQPFLQYASWSADGSKLLFTHTVEQGLELWVADIYEASAKCLTPPIINAAMGGLPYRWGADGKTVYYRAIPKERGTAPQPPTVPSGPVVQENNGKAKAVRTFQDLLKNPFDESLFDYYTTSEWIELDLSTGAHRQFLPADIYTGMSLSPDGQYFLITTLQKPYSYQVPYGRFPQRIALYNTRGEQIKVLADIPLADNIPVGFGAVRMGPRSYEWRSDSPATLYWVEAQDGGDPKVEAAVRDQLFSLQAPFSEAPQKSIAFQLRYGGLEWGHGELAICYEWWWQNRQQLTSRWQPDQPEAGKQTLFDRSWEDRYNAPGAFELKRNEYNRMVLMTADEGQSLFLTGMGASPEGNRPFVDKFHLTNSTEKNTTRLWQSEAPYYEYPVEILDEEKGLVLTRRESTNEPPNYFLRKLYDEIEPLKQLTFYKHPYPQLQGVSKELIRYKRSDGVELTGDLYLPAGYDKTKDGPLPVFMWAYPREFKSADAAGQVSNSPYEFLRLYSSSPVMFVTQGYAVLDNFSMPIIGEGEEEPNETFVQQLVDGAKAAVDYLVGLGIADAKRIAVGGHSYGAFMTANLLAHCDFFAAGIARSGAYNRTLTPFGFQAEERTFWEASDTYIKMSPFTYADKIKTPLLLIHGEADNNSGTYPLQSERFYAALKGHGAKVRLVMLPHESHGYRARESIMHTMWETSEWLKKMGEDNT